MTDHQESLIAAAENLSVTIDEYLIHQTDEAALRRAQDQLTRAITAYDPGRYDTEPAFRGHTNCCRYEDYMPWEEATWG